MSANPFSLVLSCGGLALNGFSLCAGTINVVVDFDRHMEGVHIEKVMDFIDYSCSLFDGPVTDWNKVVNVLTMFKQQFGMIDDRLWQALHIWLPQHKKCGAVLSLCLNSNLDDVLLMKDEAVIIPRRIQSA